MCPGRGIGGGDGTSRLIAAFFSHSTSNSSICGGCFLSPATLDPLPFPLRLPLPPRPRPFAPALLCPSEFSEFSSSSDELLSELLSELPSELLSELPSELLSELLPELLLEEPLSLADLSPT
jgi:hypothetical protein